MINTAVIGAGYIGNVHLESLNRLGQVRLHSVYDQNRTLAETAASRHRVPRVAESFEEIINDPSVDVIHICTPNRFHFDQSIAALQAGKQVFSEKPLAVTSMQARILTETAAACKAVTGIGFCYRYYPVVQEMAVRLRRGDFGSIRMVSGTWFQDWLSEATDYTWRLEKEQSGESNVAADLGSHWFDLVQFVTGLKVSSLMADFFTIIPEREKPESQVLAFQASKASSTQKIQIEVEDYASVMFRLDNGRVPGSFTTSQVCPGRKSETEFQVYCSEGSLAWNHKRSNELWIGRRHGPNGILIENPLEMDESSKHFATLPAGHPLGYRDAMVNMLDDYYRAVEGKDEGDGELRPNFSTGYREMLLLDRMIESAREGQWKQA
jgi:predicted dehydrogenase